MEHRGKFTYDALQQFCGNKLYEALKSARDSGPGTVMYLATCHGRQYQLFPLVVSTLALVATSHVSRRTMHSLQKNYACLTPNPTQ